jgi:hypothetical protein
MATSPDVFGTGQLPFLTRQLGEEDTDKLINSGFKFATIELVGRNIADTMQIPLYRSRRRPGLSKVPSATVG